MPPQEKMPETGHSEPSQCDSQPESCAYTNGAFLSDNNSEMGKEEQNSKSAMEKKKEESSGGTRENFEFDDLLPHIGEFGTYQKILFLLMIPFAFFVAWVYFTQIFITIIPDQHWCWVPELANLSIEQR